MGIESTEKGMTIVNNVPWHGKELRITPLDQWGKVTLEIRGERGGHQGRIRLSLDEIKKGLFRAEVEGKARQHG